MTTDRERSCPNCSRIARVLRVLRELEHDIKGVSLSEWDAAEIKMRCEELSEVVTRARKP